METIRFGIIGCGLMGREFASATLRFRHLLGLDFGPEIVAVCDLNPKATEWFRDSLPTIEQITDDHHKLIENPAVDAVYVAVPHNLHEQIYIDVLDAGKHLLGEKPFGIDAAANTRINAHAAAHPELLVRCVSELPFYPGALQLVQWMKEERFGKIIEVEAGFWKSSDLDPNKPINWKRQAATNGEYGCMGDLGLHVVHLPLRLGMKPRNVRALLTNIITERPVSAPAPGSVGGSVDTAPCDTWDNATLACEAEYRGDRIPLLLSMKRIAPGHGNTWFLRISGTQLSAEFSTLDPKHIRYLPYTSGGPQAWHEEDCTFPLAYPSITPANLEFGFSDSILQMWAAFADELASLRGQGRRMHQGFTCATPAEAAASHALFTAALESQRTGRTVELE